MPTLHVSAALAATLGATLGAAALAAVLGLVDALPPPPLLQAANATALIAMDAAIFRMDIVTFSSSVHR